MNNSYTKPIVIHYDREEVEEMIGPVRTQYDCSCGFEAPTSIEETQNLEIFVRIPEECADKDTALIRWAPTTGQAQGGAVPPEFILPFTDGTPQGGGILFDLGPAGFFGVNIDICFDVYLFSGGDAQAGGGGGFDRIPPGAVGCGGDPECTFISEIED